MANDIRSQNVGRLLVTMPIAANGSYPLDPIDTEGLAGIGFFMGGLYVMDGSYLLAFDESDNGVDWSEVPSESLIGEAVVTGDITEGGWLEKVGLFSVKRYIRPKVVASGVTIGVGGIGVSSIEKPRILPESQ